jgi:teichoic acid glycerol-phosphate primase
VNKNCGYLQGNLEHHLDHLAPFCSLMGWPLIVTDEAIFQLANRYYPGLEVCHINSLEAPFEVTQNFDHVVTTLARAAFDDIFQIAESSLQKRLKTSWLPHGNSDKGHSIPYMEALQNEETVLVYGQKMIDFLRQKDVIKPQLLPVGNFRSVYFKKHRDFYNKVLDEMGLPSCFILYAPTWKDGENSGSFDAAIDNVLNVAKEFPLVIKPHPIELEKAHVIQKKLRSSCLWLDHFPPIYPLLQRTSHLITDFSSVGYDFLTYKRPLLFYHTSEQACSFLHPCGTVVQDQDLLTCIKNPYLPLDKIQDLEAYTFARVDNV